MGRYRVIAGQNIFDVALHLYGSIEGIVDLMMNNADLSLATVLTVGQELVYMPHGVLFRQTGSIMYIPNIQRSSYAWNFTCLQPF